MTYPYTPMKDEPGQPLSALTDSLRQNFADLETRVNALSGTLDKLLKNLENASKSRSQLSRQVEAVTVQLTEFGAQLDGLDKVFGELLKRSERDAARIQSLETRLTSLESLLPSIERLNALLADA